MILRGRHVILRPYRLDDAPRFVRWFNDPKVNKFLRVRSMMLADERKWLRGKLRQSPHTAFAIDSVDGVHIGSTALEFSADSRRNHNAKFGIMIGDSRYWGRGCGTEATQLMLELAFRKMKLHRVELDVYAYNPRAERVYRKCGFRKEGVRRGHLFFSGRYHDVYKMGILKQEWQKRKR